MQQSFWSLFAASLAAAMVTAAGVCLIRFLERWVFDNAM